MFMYNWYINTLLNHQYSYWAATTHTSNYCDDYILIFILIGKSRWNMRCWSQPFCLGSLTIFSRAQICIVFGVILPFNNNLNHKKSFCMLGAQTESWEKQGMRWVDTFPLKYHRSFIKVNMIRSNIFMLKCMVTWQLHIYGLKLADSQRV